MGAATHPKGVHSDILVGSSGCHIISACKITTFCRNYQILLRKSSERQVIHAYLTHDTTFGFFSSIRS